MSVSVSMPQLGESVTEGTVTRWLKKEGERVEVDEPLLEVSTDKVDTEIPSPASGILRGISVDEDETVAVGAQLATIDDGASGDAAPAADDSASAEPAEPAQPAQSQAAPAQAAPSEAAPAQAPQSQAPQSQAPQSQAPQPETASSDGWSSRSPQPNYAPPAPSAPAATPGFPASSAPSTPAYAPPPAYGQPTAAASAPAASAPAQGRPSPAESAPSSPSSPEDAPPAEYPSPAPLPGGDAPYVTPLVRKLAAEHAVDLESVTGTGVGGRIRKQDIIEAARAQRAAQSAPQPEPPAQEAQPEAPQEVSAAQPSAAPSAPAAPQAPSAPRPAVVPSALRGTTQRMSRPRQVIAQRMVESLHVSAQLTTVVEADVTAIARLRDAAKQDFEAREGVKLSFLPFFALAAVEALKVHPKLNAVIDGDQVTYHDAEHLGIAVDTERGLMVPVIHSAGDLNIGGLARKISDLASRTRSAQVAPDELAGGTFTLTNTGSRGALFDTPIINQPQVAILGTGTVVKRPVVVTDPALGEVIAVRSMVYLALTYDHRLVDGADAARFLTTVKSRLEEGAFEAELGL
jgi:pyruvate dehydrogenase E2 component (dihydrolipoamide acetyltransferase)